MVGLMFSTKSINVGEIESITITLNENASGFIDLAVNETLVKKRLLAVKS